MATHSALHAFNAEKVGIIIIIIVVVIIIIIKAIFIIVISIITILGLKVVMNSGSYERQPNVM